MHGKHASVGSSHDTSALLNLMLWQYEAEPAAAVHKVRRQLAVGMLVHGEVPGQMYMHGMQPARPLHSNVDQAQTAHSVCLRKESLGQQIVFIKSIHACTLLCYSMQVCLMRGCR